MRRSGAYSYEETEFKPAEYSFYNGCVSLPYVDGPGKYLYGADGKEVKLSDAAGWRSPYGYAPTEGMLVIGEAEVMGGVGENRFNPLGAYTREQSYITIYRLFQAIVDKA